MSHFGLPEPQTLVSELDREKVRYDVSEQAALLATLQEESPNTSEMEKIFNEITPAIASDTETKIIFIHG